MSDRAAALAASDNDAWSDFYDDLTDRLFHYALLQTQNQETAREVVQQAFVAMYENRSKLPSVTDLDAYIFTILRNKVNRHFRDERKHTTVPIDSALVFCMDVANAGSNIEPIEWVALNLQKLTRKDRETIQLKVFAELTFAQIARVTGTPLGTVATRYRRALAKLAKCWQADS